MINLNIMIRQNTIQNFPFTVEDIDMEEKKFGPDVSIFKGTTTIKVPKVVVENFIEMPRELIEYNKDLILCVDIIFIN